MIAYIVGGTVFGKSFTIRRNLSFTVQTSTLFELSQERKYYTSLPIRHWALVLATLQ